MNIPKEAIEAAAKAAYIADNLDWAGAEAAWDDMGGSEPSYERAGWEIAARAALEAAAPLLMAQALREAVSDFECHVGVGEFAEQTVRDGIPWAHTDEAWDHQGPYMNWLNNRADELEQS